MVAMFQCPSQVTVPSTCEAMRRLRRVSGEGTTGGDTPIVLGNSNTHAEKALRDRASFGSNGLRQVVSLMRILS
jgi:hypothetical protein